MRASDGQGNKSNSNDSHTTLLTGVGSTVGVGVGCGVGGCNINLVRKHQPLATLNLLAHMAKGLALARLMSGRREYMNEHGYAPLSTSHANKACSATVTAVPQQARLFTKEHVQRKGVSQHELSKEP
jgi:hypothetical protein